jgi:lipopolysaccharide export system protein LptA
MNLFSTNRQLIAVVVFSLTFVSLPTLLFPKDEFITFRSSRDIKLDEPSGTAILEGDVFVKQESTGSTLVSDKLFIQRDKQSKKPIQAKAQGNVHMVLNNRDDTTQKVRTFTITCKFAEVDRTSNKAILSGLVTIKSHDFELTADTVFYDLQKESGIISEVPGKQVRFKTYKNTVPIGAHGENQISAPGVIDGASDEIRVNRSLRKTTLQGKVVIFDHSEQARFTANRADVFFDQNEKLDRIIAYQNVRITQPKRRSAADRAVFDYKTETVVLTGKASVQEIDQLEINSATITMHMNEDKGIITGNQNIPLKGKVRIPQ